MVDDHRTYLYDTSNGTHAQGACGASVVEWARANVACAMVQGGPTALSCRHNRVQAQVSNAPAPQQQPGGGVYNRDPSEH